MLNYLYMGTPAFAATILEHLCNEGFRPAAVVTQVAKAAGRGQKLQPTAVEVFAKSQGLEVFATPDVNSVETLSALKALAPEVVLVAAFGQILKDELLRLPKRYSLNVHASLLPKYRGAAPIQRSIWDGDTFTGITIQKMAKKLDTGDILLQEKLEILPEETSGELFDRLAVLGGKCLVESLRLIESGQDQFTEQDHSLATYAKKITREDASVDWSLPAEVIHRQIRALQPWPVAETFLGKDRLKIFKAILVDGKSGLEPGEIVTDGRTNLVVACGNGRALSLTEVQLENRKKLVTRDFLNSYRGLFPFKKMERSKDSNV